MFRKMLATLAATAVLSAGMVGMAEAAPPNPCENKLTPLARVNSADSGKKIYSMARTKKSRKANEHTSVKIAVQVWSPNPKHKNGGQWTRLGKEGYDQHGEVAAEVVEVGLLPGKQKYRSAALFVCVTKGKVYKDRRIGKAQTFIRNNTPYYGVDISKGREWGTGHGGWSGKGDGGAWGKKWGGWSSGRGGGGGWGNSVGGWGNGSGGAWGDGSGPGGW